MFAATGCRSIWRTESEDFLEWSAPELVMAPDLCDAPEVELYGMSVFRRHDWLLGLVEYWNSETDVIEVHLAFSRDGRQWSRPTPRAPFIAPAHDWNRAWSSCASNGPVFVGDQMVFHFGGRWVSHHFDSAQQFGVVGMASLPVDRFCGIEGGPGGMIETPAFRWPGGTLELNADTRESFASHPAKTNGEIRVEVLDAEGRGVAGWSGKDQARYSGNTYCRCARHPGEVTWPGGRRLEELAGQSIRLRMHLRHARLFTWEAREDSPRGAHAGR
jgi:hypothetical protein